MNKLIVNCETGETEERELNKAEKDQQKKDEALAQQYEMARVQEVANKAALLARLGLTEDELKTILG
jgi:hypothetical protein